MIDGYCIIAGGLSVALDRCERSRVKVGTDFNAIPVREVKCGRVEEVSIRIELGHTSGFSAGISRGISSSVRFAEVSIGVTIYAHVAHRDDHRQEEQATKDIPALSIGFT